MNVQHQFGQNVVKQTILGQTQVHSDIITVAHAIGRKGFKELKIEHIAYTRKKYSKLI